MKTLSFLAILGLFFFIGAGAQAHKVGNGGSLVVDGQTYDLADLHFKPNSFASYTFDTVIENEMYKLKSLLNRLNLRLEHSGGDEFFNNYIFNELIEYRFVGRLPSDCQFMTRENLPAALAVEDMACTKGYVTYLIPSYFLKLNVIQQTLLLIHERLQFFAPEQPYDLKTEIIRAFDLLLTRYDLAAQAGSQQDIFSDDEVALLNRLSIRFRQLNNDKRPMSGYPTHLWFLKTGAALEASDYYKSGQPVVDSSVTLGAGTLVSFTGDPKTARLSGKNFRILNSVVRLSDTELSGVDSVIQNMVIGLSFGGYSKCSVRLLAGTVLQNAANFIFECQRDTVFQFGKPGATTLLDGEGSHYPYRLRNSGPSSLLSIESQEKLRSFIDTTPDYGH